MLDSQGVKLYDFEINQSSWKLLKGPNLSCQQMTNMTNVPENGILSYGVLTSIANTGKKLFLKKII